MKSLSDLPKLRDFKEEDLEYSKNRIEEIETDEKKESE